MEHKISIFIVTLLVLAESAFAADAPPMSEPIQLQVDSKVSLYPDSIGFFDEHPAPDLRRRAAYRGGDWYFSTGSSGLH